MVDPPPEIHSAAGAQPRSVLAKKQNTTDLMIDVGWMRTFMSLEPDPIDRIAHCSGGRTLEQDAEQFSSGAGGINIPVCLGPSTQVCRK